MAIEIIYKKSGECKFGTWFADDELDRLSIIETLEAKGYEVLYCDYE